MEITTSFNFIHDRVSMDCRATVTISATQSLDPIFLMEYLENHLIRGNFMHFIRILELQLTCYNITLGTF